MHIFPINFNSSVFVIAFWLGKMKNFPNFFKIKFMGMIYKNLWAVIEFNILFAKKWSLERLNTKALYMHEGPIASQ